MKAIDIHLLGRTYQVACAPGEEGRLQQLSRMLEEKMKVAAGLGQGAIGEIRLLLLAGLMLADDVLEARGETDRSLRKLQYEQANEEDLMVSAVDHLAGRINALAQRWIVSGLTAGGVKG